jgi:hypothetical protein
LSQARAWLVSRANAEATSRSLRGEERNSAARPGKREQVARRAFGANSIFRLDRRRRCLHRDGPLLERRSLGKTLEQAVTLEISPLDSGRADALAGRAKVELAAGALSRFEVVRHVGRVEDAIREIDAARLPWPPIVLSGLDSVEARYATQLLWPDEIIDAAPGDTALGLHDAVDDDTCLMCFFPRHDGPSAMTRLIDATGLTRDQLADGDRPLAAEDLGQLSSEKRERLLPHLGKPVCGLAQAIGLTAESDDSYQPAVPFVSHKRPVSAPAGSSPVFSASTICRISSSTTR